MADTIFFDIGQGIKADSGTWYRNVQRLGVGGNAVTFLVLATSASARGVPFALKVFRRLSKPERRDSFIREAAFLEKCDHPSVMRIYDVGIYLDKHPFLVAEYLPRTLESVIRSRSASTVQTTVFILQLLSALDYLSTQDPPVVHRDLKPQNVFVNGPSCVLGDFGLMKHVEKDIPDDVEFVKESIGYGMPY